MILMCLRAQAEGPRPAQGPPAGAERAETTRPDEMYELVWSAPKECPSDEDLRSWLSAIVPDASLASALRIQVEITATERGYLAKISVIRATQVDEMPEVREVEGRHCDEVARSAVVVASVQIAELSVPPEEPRESTAPRKATFEQASHAPSPPPRSPALRPAPKPPRTKALPKEEAAPQAAMDLELLLGAGSGFPERPAFRIDVASHFSLTNEWAMGLRAQIIPYVELANDRPLGALTLVAPGPELCYLRQLVVTARLGLCSRVGLGYASATGNGNLGRSDTGAVGTLALSPTLTLGRTVSILVQGDIDYRFLRPRFINSSEVELVDLPEVAISGLAGVKMEMF